MSDTTTDDLATIISTDDLIEAAEQGNRIGYNRQADPAALRRMLDPDGVHFLTFSMAHEHIAGQPVEPHVRTIWACKLRDVEPELDKAERVTIDMEFRRFMALNKMRRIEGGPRDGGYEVVHPDGTTTFIPGAGESA